MSEFVVLNRLDEFRSYMGGRTCLYGKYVWEFVPGHRLQNKWGWVAQHRLVGEMILGRDLVQSADEDISEVVHDKNEDPADNRPENLEILIKRSHRQHHARLSADKLLSKLNDANVISALDGRTIREAAAHLGTTHMTIRRRFPELIAHRKRKAPTDTNDPKWPAILAPYAKDLMWTLAATGDKLGMSWKTVATICRKHQIQWVANKSIGRTGRPRGSKNKSPRKSSPITKNVNEIGTAQLARLPSRQPFEP